MTLHGYDISGKNTDTDTTVTPHLPLSKSIALRAMTLNAVSLALGNGTARIPQLPDSDDVKGMMRAIDLSNCQCKAHRDSFAPDRHIVNIGEGGAPFRFFTALAASSEGIDLTLLAKKSLMRRPMSILLGALRDAGADISPIRRPGRAPLHIRGQKICGGQLSMNPSVSSQFVSALMMVAPLWENGLDLRFDGGEPVSAPYIRMTAEIMRRFGCIIEIAPRHIHVAPGICSAPETFLIEPDWSAASYFYEYALLKPGTPVTLASLTPPSLSCQGDSRCAEIFAMTGVDTQYTPDGKAVLTASAERIDTLKSSGSAICLDMNDTPDLVPALAVALSLAGIKWKFTSVAHLRHKETDRMTALGNELARLGYILRLSDDQMEWDGSRTPPDSEIIINTYSDHRMAMAFAPAKILFHELTIKHPEVVAKSFPDYFSQISLIKQKV